MSLEIYGDLLQKLTNIGPELLLGLAVIGMCYGLKFIPIFPNRWIPAMCIFSPTLIYPVLAPCAHDGAGLCRCGLVGFLIGCASWLVHNQVLKRFLDGRLAGKRNDNGEHQD